MGKYIAAGFLAVILIASSASADTITKTGAELATEAGVTFPNATPSVNGTSLDFFGPRPNNALLLRWDLPSIASITGPTQITLTANFTKITSDTDPMVGLGDATNYAAAGIFDRARAYRRTGAHNGTTYTVPNFASGPNAGPLLTTYEITGVFNVDVGQITSFTAIATSGANTSTVAGTPRAFTGPLSIYLFGQSPGERYRLNSLSVESDLIGGSVPEPAAGLLLFAGAAFLRFRRRR